MVKLQEILIGNIAVKLNLLTPQQLEECLNEQDKTKPRKPLGLIMIEKGYLTKEKLDELLKIQSETIERKSDEYQKSLQDNLFGRILIVKKLVSAEDVYDAVKVQATLLQRGIRKRLGTILVEKGLLTESQVKEVLEIQNKKVLYCEKCDLIFTVEWVLGRVYACTKCGKRLLVPPKTIMVTETEPLITREKLTTSVTAPKISLPKEELQEIYKKIEERVTKIDIKPIPKIEKGENFVISFFKFLIFKPYTLIAFVVLIGVVIFININLKKQEGESNIVATVKLPKEIDTSFLTLPSVSSEDSLKFDIYIAAQLRHLVDNNLEDLCGITKKDGKFLNIKSEQPVTPIEALDCENKIKSKMKNIFQSLYYMGAEYEIMSFDLNTKELRLKIEDFFSTDQDLRDIYIRFENAEVNIGSKIYLYGISIGSDPKTKIDLYLSWCTYLAYKSGPVLKFMLPTEKIKEKDILSTYGVKLYFYLLPHFQFERAVYARLARAELVARETGAIKDTFLCKEEGE